MSNPLHRIRHFKTKLSLALMGLGAAAAVMVCALLITIHYIGMRQLIVESLSTQAEVIASHSEAALAFEDPETASETLHALEADTGIAWAGLFSEDGALFAAYDPIDGRPPPANLAAASQAAAQLDLVLYIEPVFHEERRLGTVIIAYDATVVYQRLWRDVVLSLTVGAAVMAIAVLLAFWLRGLLTRPLSELVAASRHIARTGDYSARAQKHSPDEFGDLTDTFNAMLERIQAQDAELHHYNRDMQQFLYTVSHDLKSPLVTITGFVGLLKEDLSQQQYDHVDESLAHLTRASQHMGELIDDLLELSRIGRIRNRPELLDVSALVQEIVTDLTPRAQESGACLQVQPDLPPITADRVRLTQVFENLLNNAIKYGITETGGTIEVGGHRTDGEVCYFVRDHGPGIPPEFEKRVFALFQRLHTSKEGTGVGLTIVTKIIHTHGGRVWFDHTPGGGATFWIALPDPPLPPDASARHTLEPFERELD